MQRCKDDIGTFLTKFDKAWTHFEQSYVSELMVIEADARRLVVEAIKIEEELRAREMQKKRSKLDEARLREKFLHKVNQINAVANTDGRGRDDLSMEIA